MTNFACTCDNDVVVNLTCILKPARNKPGILTMKAYMARPITDLVIEVRHFYKPIVGRNPQYYPYVFNIDIRWCEIVGKKGEPPNLLAKALFQFGGLVFGKKALEKCPHMGKFEVLNMDLDKMYDMSILYGQMIPEGYHKFKVRLRSDNTNQTYMTVMMVLYVKSKRGLDMSMLSMG